MPRTAAQYPSTTSPASASTAASSVVATLVASRALSVWSNPPALDAQGSGGATVAGVTEAGGAAGDGAGARGGASARQGGRLGTWRRPGAAQVAVATQMPPLADALPEHVVRWLATLALCCGS